MEMVAESANPTKGCRICAVPIQMLVPPPPPPPDCGSSVWEVQFIVTETTVGWGWVLIDNNCTGSGTPVAPTTPVDVSNEGQTETTGCDCG